MVFYLDSSAHAFTYIFGMWKIGFIISREKLLISAWSILSADSYQNICNSKINFTLFTVLVVMNHIQNHQNLIQKTALEREKMHLVFPSCFSVDYYQVAFFFFPFLILICMKIQIEMKVMY